MTKEKLPRAHHLTAQRYLRFFSSDDTTIYRYDKTIRKGKDLPIVVVGLRNDYYTFVNQKGEKDTSIEKPLLSDIDGSYSSLVEKFKSKIPIESFRKDLITFLSMQYARVETQRDRWKRIINDLNDQKRGLGVPEEKLWPNNNNSLNLVMLMEANGYSKIVSGGDTFPSVLVSEGDEFVTCDNPADKAFLPLTMNMCLIMPAKKYPQEYTLVPNSVVKTINQATISKAKRIARADANK